MRMFQIDTDRLTTTFEQIRKLQIVMLVEDYFLDDFRGEKREKTSHYHPFVGDELGCLQGSEKNDRKNVV